MNFETSIVSRSALEPALLVVDDDLLAAVERDLCSTRQP